jgi:hypothetical protein
MNRQLKRIEQTLQQLEKIEAIVVANPVAPSTSPMAKPPVILSNSSTATFTVSFDLGSRPKTVDSGSRSKISTDLMDLVEPVRDPQVATKAAPVEPFVARPAANEPPPESKLPSFSQVNSAHSTFTRHNNTVNPDIAINLLQESLKLTTSWRSELQTVVEEIQAVYRSGPIIDGWLECSTQKVDTTTHLLRHAEVNQLMDYVETLCSDPSNTHAEYQLCGLNDDGQVWSSPVPLVQVASISMAIVRHQKLQTLLVQKQVLERRLMSAAEAATKFQGQIQAIE